MFVVEATESVPFLTSKLVQTESVVNLSILKFPLKSFEMRFHTFCCILPSKFIDKILKFEARFIQKSNQIDHLFAFLYTEYICFDKLELYIKILSVRRKTHITKMCQTFNDTFA